MLAVEFVVFRQRSRKICLKHFNFTIKYLNNTLATIKKFFKWSLSSISASSFCLQFETLQHIASSCKSYLDDGRYTWRHNSVLSYLAKSMSSIKSAHCMLIFLSRIFKSIVTIKPLNIILLLQTFGQNILIVIFLTFQ